MATDEKYPALNRENLTILIQIELPQTKITFSQFFAAFLKFRLNVEYFEEKNTLTAYVFSKLQALKTWLDKCLKSPVSEDPLTINMVNVPKHCWNLHHSTLIIFILHWQLNCNRENLSDWYAKSWDCVLTHWLPMKTMLFLIETI